ncbi:hypothetical protein TSAR_012526, partial [Trichomalopsis sarcophagae]
KFCPTGDLNPHSARGQISTSVRLSRLSSADVVPYKQYNLQPKTQFKCLLHFT